MFWFFVELLKMNKKNSQIKFNHDYKFIEMFLFLNEYLPFPVNEKKNAHQNHAHKCQVKNEKYRKYHFVAKYQIMFYDKIFLINMTIGIIFTKN